MFITTEGRGRSVVLQDRFDTSRYKDKESKMEKKNNRKPEDKGQNVSRYALLITSEA